MSIKYAVNYHKHNTVFNQEIKTKIT